MLLLGVALLPALHVGHSKSLPTTLMPHFGFRVWGLSAPGGLRCRLLGVKGSIIIGL